MLLVLHNRLRSASKDHQISGNRSETRTASRSCDGMWPRGDQASQRGRWIVVAIAHRSSRMPAKSPRTTTAALASVEVLLTNAEAAFWSASWSYLYPRIKVLAELAPILPVLSKAEKWIMSMLICLSCERREVVSSVRSTEGFIGDGRLDGTCDPGKL